MQQGRPEFSTRITSLLQGSLGTVGDCLGGWGIFTADRVKKILQTNRSGVVCVGVDKVTFSGPF